jgi:rhomboid protease GluP
MIFYIPVIFLILVILFIYILPNLINFSNSYNSSFEEFIQSYWKDNEAIKNGEYYRLLTATFLHIDVRHLVYNIFGLIIFADVLPFLSSFYSFWYLIYLAIFVFAGVIGNLFSFLFNPNPSLGASGAVFGMVGFLVFLTGFSNLNLWLYIIISFVFSSMPGSKTDNFAHFGGLLAGILAGFFILM